MPVGRPFARRLPVRLESNSAGASTAAGAASCLGSSQLPPPPVCNQCQLCRHPELCLMNNITISPAQTFELEVSTQGTVCSREKPTQQLSRWTQHHLWLSAETSLLFTGLQNLTPGAGLFLLREGKQAWPQRAGINSAPSFLPRFSQCKGKEHDIQQRDRARQATRDRTHSCLLTSKPRLLEPRR